MTLFIVELNTGRTHKRHFPSVSCRYEVRRNHIVIMNYYTGEILHRYDVSKYGSVMFWVED